MPGLSSLEIGKRGLQAQQYALDVTSNNIANINTPGYSRRSAILTQSLPKQDGKFYYGTGVMVDGIQSYRREYFDKEVRSSQNIMAGYDKDVEIYKQIETILAEPSDLALGEAVTKFFQTFDNLALKPEDEALRQYVIDNAHSMSEQFNQVGDKIQQLRNDVFTQLEQQVTKANILIQNIAELNKAVEYSKPKVGQDVQTYFDDREHKLEQLSEITEINITSNASGSLNVYANGIILISGKDFNPIKSKERTSNTFDDRIIEIVTYNNEVEQLSEIRSDMGTMGTLLKHYNTTLNNQANLDEFSIAREIDEFANALVTNVNKILNEGYGKDDLSSLSPKRNLFRQLSGQFVGASAMEIEQQILNSPRDLPISGKPDAPGNSDIARRIAREAQNGKFLDNRTPNEFYTSFLGKLGTISNFADTSRERQGIILEQLENQRESFLGVNEDEEAINLIKYQRVYQACARVISTLNEMLGILVNLGR